MTGKIFLATHLLGWIFLFGAGAVVDTESCRDAFKAPASLLPSEILGCSAVVFFFYTPTNVAWLAISAGVLGAVGRIAQLGTRPVDAHQDDRVHPYISGAIRGFIVYLAVISGVLFLTSDPFTAPTAGQYVRLAGLVSVVSFVVSYNPELFARILTRIGAVLEEDAEEKRSRRKTPSETDSDEEDGHG
jgi:hypothetical protein